MEGINHISHELFEERLAQRITLARHDVGSALIRVASLPKRKYLPLIRMVLFRILPSRSTFELVRGWAAQENGKEMLRWLGVSYVAMRHEGEIAIEGLIESK